MQGYFFWPISMSFDICPYCDGTGERDFLSGARCYYCNGTGMIPDEDPDEEYLDEQWQDELREDEERDDWESAP